MGSLWWWVFRTCVLPGWVAGLILWRTSSLASRRLDSRNGAKVVKEVTLSKVVNANTRVSDGVLTVRQLSQFKSQRLN